MQPRLFWHIFRATGAFLLVGQAGFRAEAGDAVPPVTDSSRARGQEILTKLQERNEGLKDIRCEIRMVDDNRIDLTKWTRSGNILLMFAEPNPTLLIQFDRTESDGVVGKREWYLFDGRWLHEGIERLQQVTRRELAAPGEKVDLFDMERAPFPMPFGQKKDTILRHFDVALAAPSANDPPETDHLVCTPKAESRFYGKYDKMEFFVRHGLNLPVRIVTTGNKGLEIRTADFADLTEKSINTGLSKKDFAEPAEWKKYKIVVDGEVPVEHVPNRGE